jgi:hypothetical protein
MYKKILLATLATTLLCETSAHAANPWQEFSRNFSNMANSFWSGNRSRDDYYYPPPPPAYPYYGGGYGAYPYAAPYAYPYPPASPAAPVKEKEKIPPQINPSQSNNYPLPPAQNYNSVPPPLPPQNLGNSNTYPPPPSNTPNYGSLPPLPPVNSNTYAPPPPPAPNAPNYNSAPPLPPQNLGNSNSYNYPPPNNYQQPFSSMNSNGWGTLPNNSPRP